MTHASAPSHRHILLASLTGTAVEFYDFYIYATAAALVFGPLFFPASSPTAQLLLSYASFGLAFVARPVGAVAFAFVWPLLATVACPDSADPSCGVSR